MIAVPFVYFSILLIFIIRRKKKYEISAYLVTLYLITSFFAILLNENRIPYSDLTKYEITIIPTVVYCFLLTLTILPFYNFKSEKINYIKLSNLKVFKSIIYTFFASFLLIVISSFNSILRILKGDFREQRLDLSRGEAIIDISLGIFQPIYVFANILGSYSIIMLLFYFYSICFLQNSKKFNSIILLSSTTIIIVGILGVDRSKTVYWIITYGFMIVFFWRFMTKKARRKIFKISVVLITILLSYFIIITISRFGDHELGTDGGLLSYAGQSFIQFCFFFDNVHYPNLSLQRIFPWYYNLFVDNNINSTVELNDDIRWKTGYAAGVFSTFIGDIMVSSGKLAVIIYCIAFYFYSNGILKVKNIRQIGFHDILFVFCLISIPMLGIFTHFYANHSRTMPFIGFMVYGYYLKYNNRIKNN